MSDLAKDVFGGTSSYTDLRDASFLPNSGENFNKTAMGLSGLRVASAVAGTIPGGELAGTVIGMVGKAIGGGLNAWDAQKTVAALRQIESSINGTAVGPDYPADEKAVLKSCVEHLLAKQGIRRNAEISKATVAGQPLETAYRAGKAVYKFARGTKGKHRKESAAAIYELVQNGKPTSKQFARNIVEVVAKSDFENMIKSTLANAFKSS